LGYDAGSYIVYSYHCTLNQFLNFVKCFFITSNKISFSVCHLTINLLKKEPRESLEDVTGPQ